MSVVLAYASNLVSTSVVLATPSTAAVTSALVASVGITVASAFSANLVLTSASLA